MNRKIRTNKNRVIDFYDKYMKNPGATAGWKSKESADKAYRAMAEIIFEETPNPHSILDIGSGEGHFSLFMRENYNFIGEYTGLELIPDFFNISMERYGQNIKNKFILGEFLEFNFHGNKYAWVCSLGSLSVKQKDQDDYDLAFCAKMASLAEIGFSVYLNDIEFIDPIRLEKVSDLAAHNIDAFIEMLNKHFDDIKIKVLHFPSSNSQRVIISVRL